MASKIKNALVEIARKQNGYLKTQDLITQNISKSYITAMCNDGLIEKVKRGLYRTTDIEPQEHEFFIDAQKALAPGIICFESALTYHQLSMINPPKIHMALKRKTMLTIPDYPPVKIHYFADWYYEIGIGEVLIRNEPVKIYTPEKTVCDCIKYQKKMGTDLMKEALSTYLKNRKNRDINLLYEIAQKCKIEQQIKAYLEVLL
jgi:predicted transcriptional regulator of viral defense system